jgi:Flp pilus assembly protein TadD
VIPETFTQMRQALLSALLVSALFAAAPALAQSDTPQAAPQAEQPSHNDPNLRGRDRILNELFERLAKADDQDEAKGVAGAIERVFLRSGSDTADLLMNRALSSVRQRDFKLANELLDKLVVIEPEWAEAWNQRATARFRADDVQGAVADLGQVLALEPRHFGALSALGYILYSNGFDRRALDVMRRTLVIYPQQEDIRKLVEQLGQKIDGRDL